MSKRCPDCHRLNDDGRIYCAFCGEPLDNNVRMIRSLEKEISAAPREPAQSAPRGDGGDDDYEYIPPVKTRQKKGSAVPWLILLAAAAIALWFFLSR